MCCTALFCLLLVLVSCIVSGYCSGLPVNSSIYMSGPLTFVGAGCGSTSEHRSAITLTEWYGGGVEGVLVGALT